MKIPAHIEEVHVSLAGLSFSQPFRPPNSEFLVVSIKDERKTTLFKVFFEDSKSASVLKNTRKETVTLLEQAFLDDEGRELEKIYFYTKKCADTYISQYISRTTEKISRPNMMNVGFGDDEFGDDPYDADLDVLMEEFESDFEQKLTVASIKAENVLKSAAKYFLNVENVQNNEWLEHKIDMEKRSLSLMIFQADVSEIAIKKLMGAIYTNTAGVKQFEALASLQKIVLDISKSQSVLVERMVKDFKEMKERAKEITDGNVDEEMEQKDGVLLRGNNIGNILNVARELSQEASDETQSIEEEE